jgi:hypothetical protein
MTNLFLLLLTFGALRPDTTLLEAGDIQDLALTADRIYAATGRGLVVFDETLHRIGNYNSPGSARSVAVDSFVFIADGDNGLVVIDTARFHPLRTIKIEGEAQSVRIYHPYLLVGTGAGLALFKGEDNPQFDRLIPVPGGVKRFQVQGDYVYALTPTGLTTVNLKDSTEPAQSLPLSNPVDLALGKGYLYVASDSGLGLFGISDPHSPKELKNFTPPASILALAVNPPFIYLATADSKLVIFENRSNQMLRPIRSITTDAAGHSLALGNDFLYAGQRTGLDRLAVQNPTEAAITGSYRFDNPGIVSDVARIGKNAVVVGEQSGMWIIDPAAAAVIKRLPAIRFSNVATARGDTVIFIIDRHLGILGFDLPKPEEPIRNYINASGLEATAATVVKDRLIVAGPKELHEYEICPCKALSDKVVFNLPAPGFDVAKIGGRLYAALGDSGILAVDSAASFRIPVVAHRMLFQLNILYILDRKFGLRIYNIVSPRSPTLIGELPVAGEPQDFLLIKNNLYIAAGRTGIHIVDVLNPNRPKEIGLFDTPGDARRLARVGTRLLVADYYSLEILKLPQ